MMWRINGSKRKSCHLAIDNKLSNLSSKTLEGLPLLALTLRLLTPTLVVGNLLYRTFKSSEVTSQCLEEDLNQFLFFESLQFGPFFSLQYHIPSFGSLLDVRPETLDMYKYCKFFL